MKWSVVVLFIVMAGLAGCEKPQITVVDVPATAPASVVGSSSAKNQGRFSYTLPNGWVERQGDALRLATFGVPIKDGVMAEVSVVTLSGDAGGKLANVNRWRGQLRLGPITESELAKIAVPLTVNGQAAVVVDMDSDGQRTIAVILETGVDSWFFKMTGPDKALETVKSEFLTFVSGVTIR